MAIKFRNSLLGFNKEDVHNFVMSAKENEYKYENTIKDLEKSIAELNNNISNLNNELNAIKDELAVANEKVKDFEAREEAITKLSQSIGRLYLVAQTNAKAIANATKENIEASRKAVDMNINAAENAENDFIDIEQQLNEKIKTFNNEMTLLRVRLSETKERLEENNTVIADSDKNLDKLTANIKA